MQTSGELLLSIKIGSSIISLLNLVSSIVLVDRLVKVG